MRISKADQLERTSHADNVVSKVVVSKVVVSLINNYTRVELLKVPVLLICLKSIG